MFHTSACDRFDITELIIIKYLFRTWKVHNNKSETLRKQKSPQLKVKYSPHYKNWTIGSHAWLISQSYEAIIWIIMVTAYTCIQWFILTIEVAVCFSKNHIKSLKYRHSCLFNCNTYGPMRHQFRCVYYIQTQYFLIHDYSGELYNTVEFFYRRSKFFQIQNELSIASCSFSLNFSVWNLDDNGRMH